MLRTPCIGAIMADHWTTRASEADVGSGETLKWERLIITITYVEPISSDPRWIKGSRGVLVEDLPLPYSLFPLRPCFGKTI